MISKTFANECDSVRQVYKDSACCGEGGGQAFCTSPSLSINKPGFPALTIGGGVIFPIPLGKFIYYDSGEWLWYDYIGKNGACDWYIEDNETHPMRWVSDLSDQYPGMTGHLRCTEHREDGTIGSGYYILYNHWRPFNTTTGKIDLTIGLFHK